MVKLGRWETLLFYMAIPVHSVFSENPASNEWYCTRDLYITLTPFSITFEVFCLEQVFLRDVFMRPPSRNTCLRHAEK